MEILVCVKRVPDTAENEIEVSNDSSDIERDDLVYSVNEWDNYAVEEAIQIVDKAGGAVTVVSLGDEESEEVVRREMAMGANNGILVSDDAFERSDGKGVASILKAVVEKGNYDLILTGAQADDGAGQIGGMLAAMLDVPYASVVNTIEVLNDAQLKIGREIEGGNQEMNEIALPCVLSIQTGINWQPLILVLMQRVWVNPAPGLNGSITLFPSLARVLKFLKAAMKRLPKN
jgi:electron transfer flavoprotein beta subunit